MIPGPDIFYKCPICKGIIFKGSNLSGNTFGAMLYSDGKMIAPMLPEYPQISMCYYCKHIFWLKKEYLVSIVDYNLDENENINRRKGSHKANFLNYSQYDTLLKNKMYDNPSEERYLRIRHWWSANDEIRNTGTTDSNYYKEKKCVENMKALIIILTEDRVELIKSEPKKENEEEINNNTFMTAELFRNLGEFQNCKTILQDIKDPVLFRIKEMIEKECDKGNNLVFRVE